MPHFLPQDVQVQLHNRLQREEKPGMGGLSRIQVQMEIPGVGWPFLSIFVLQFFLVCVQWNSSLKPSSVEQLVGIHFSQGGQEIYMNFGEWEEFSG